MNFSEHTRKQTIRSAWEIENNVRFVFSKSTKITNSAIANELRTMLQEKIVKEEMIFIQPHIKLMCDLLAERNKKDMFDPVVGQIMRIYGYFVMKKVRMSSH